MAVSPVILLHVAPFPPPSRPASSYLLPFFVSPPPISPLILLPFPSTGTPTLSAVAESPFSTFLVPGHFCDQTVTAGSSLERSAS
eukprot:600024-Rhodomonas_salina.4